MPRTKTLSDLQLSIMDVLWNVREATVAEVLESLAYQKPLARTTIATMINRLEKHRYIDHKKVGGTHVYFPIVEREIVEQDMVKELVDSLYRGQASRLVSQLLSETTIDRAEIERVIALVKSSEAKNNDR